MGRLEEIKKRLAEYDTDAELVEPGFRRRSAFEDIRWLLEQVEYFSQQMEKKL